jgi:5-formaminoimidazole-4-carboxamide-1-beta-D-ribofuranosyl 5'-monophosphate synthetase
MSTIEHGRSWINESPKFFNDTKPMSFFRRGERYTEKLLPDHVKNLPSLITNELKKLIRNSINKLKKQQMVIIKNEVFFHYIGIEKVVKKS